MNVFRMSLAASLLLAGTAQAGVVDFTDGIYDFDIADLEFVGPFGVGVETKITEEAAGVQFTITPRFQDDEPETWLSLDGLIFGPQGDPLTGLSIVADQDIVLTSFEGRLVSAPPFFDFEPRIVVPTAPGFPPIAPGRPTISQTSRYSDALSEVELFGGTYTLTAGSELFIDYFTDQPVDGRITRLFFDGATGGGGSPIDPVDPGIAPVPLPASSLLLLFGLGGIAALRHTRNRQPV